MSFFFSQADVQVLGVMFLSDLLWQGMTLPAPIPFPIVPWQVQHFGLK
jgi:hypothetical protein